MSDFLDRLAARAIGSESALTPRLSSLFEPLHPAPLMPLVEEGEKSSGRNADPSVATIAPTFAPMRSSPPSMTGATQAASSVSATIKPAPTSAPASVAASAPIIAVPPVPVATTPALSPMIERAVPPSTPSDPSAPPRVRPRETRLAVKSPEPSTSSPVASGALLPLATPVFGPARAAASTDRPVQPAAMQAHSAPASPGISSSEPVVHVSIGRLEVRASPAAAAALPRRDAPKPSSLDDYLRQRGKASP